MKADQGGENGGQPVNAVHMPSECRTVIRRGVKSSLLLADGAKVFAPPEGRKSLSSVYSMRSTTYTSLAERDACLHSSTPAAPEEMDAFPEASFVVRRATTSLSATRGMAHAAASGGLFSISTTFRARSSR